MYGPHLFKLVFEELYKTDPYLKEATQNFIDVSKQWVSQDRPERTDYLKFKPTLLQAYMDDLVIRFENGKALKRWLRSRCQG